ncbi:MAG: DNA-formamidopyrimidine glycosylase [Metamycoplasmataceae bacterium]
MPELPEVETVKNYLNKKIVNEVILKVDVLNEKLIKNASKKEFIFFLINEKIIDVKRKGKYLIFLLTNNKMMISHLRMEGKYFINSKNKKNITKHDHIIFETENFFIKYNDSRAFGTFNIYYNQNYNEEIKIGIEPLDENLNLNIFNEMILKNKKKNIKSFLLDQKYICGIGNIYANEILFEASIDPKYKCSDLDEKQIQILLNVIKKIIKRAIDKKGTTISSFSFNNDEIGSYQNYLKVHSKKVCKKCDSKIVKEKIANRGTYYCPNCQK